MSKTTSPKAFKALLSGNRILAELAKQARKSPSAEEQDPRDCLPPALRERVTLVRDQHRWLALVETSATAQLLRFHLPRLQQALPGEQVKIVVGGKRQPLAKSTGSQPPGEQSNYQAKGPTLSKESAGYIQALAEDMDDDALKASLLRLASRWESE
ncbi:hypothetical protein MWU49_15095 [Alcanivorax sp. S6407]|uniref:hypothetical protein n=1 Tax=Alcanivorax sp. S6407 TaxID=2926424 RepID=UPI001FF51B0F|nr:hypothetical protein [Alcanivorax sp. S6407]MCK0155040.1 hypothetical protein [Alcanivorax sp. S6407]